MKQGKQGVYARYIKRILDVLLSGCALIVLSPVLLIVAVLVRTKLGSPVIFCQERPGKDEKIFKMYKFRSMTDARDENGELLPDELRLTKFGRALRATSLDELPELWNNWLIKMRPKVQPVLNELNTMISNVPEEVEPKLYAKK